MSDLVRNIETKLKQRRFISFCKGCKRYFSNYWTPSHRRKYCSRKCYSSNVHSKIISKALKGVPKTQEHVKAASDAHRGIKHPSIQGENHPFWKGDDVGYHAVHDWIAKNKEKPKECLHCGKKPGFDSIGRNKIHWANVSGEYKRDLNDFIPLCIKCHRDYDGTNPWQIR